MLIEEPLPLPVSGGGHVLVGQRRVHSQDCPAEAPPLSPPATLRSSWSVKLRRVSLLSFSFLLSCGFMVIFLLNSA
jgi:hypothetical protein